MKLSNLSIVFYFCIVALPLANASFFNKSKDTLIKEKESLLVKYEKYIKECDDILADPSSKKSARDRCDERLARYRQKKIIVTNEKNDLTSEDGKLKRSGRSKEYYQYKENEAKAKKS